VFISGAVVCVSGAVVCVSGANLTLQFTFVNETYSKCMAHIGQRNFKLLLYHKINVNFDNINIHLLLFCQRSNNVPSFAESAAHHAAI